MSDFKKIEQKWQKRWEEARLFETEPDKDRKKVFVTIPYPYVNGSPHLGHAYSFMRGDAYARFKRMQGFNVLLPQGFHATGEPIVGVVERVRNGDKDQIEALKNLGASDKDIKDFSEKGPEFVADYWMKVWKETLKSAGYSCDWRRSFITAITPTYNRFIQWQYNTLRKKGFVVQGTHPVVWCAHDQSPTGDHDRLVGEGEGPVEYTIIKFRLETGDVLPCATMRPETAYGATNVWVDPEADYVLADVDGETWIIGDEAVKKIADQLHRVEIKGRKKGSEIVGNVATNPVTGSTVPVLPAGFVESKMATGVVMSVPAHAPYDWMGLHDLKENPEPLERMGIDPKILDKVAPISIIKVEGMGDFPAIETCDKMLITSQLEREKLDQATDEVYRKEFHTGVMKKSTGHAGVKVSEAKDKISSDFVKRGLASIFWETSSEVVCRCGNRCHVKILENQWFLKFSDEKWKRIVREAISKMDFYPEISRQQFLNTVDWLKDKACARKSGLGTKLPWDQDWIVETLSDSVIYMAYYTFSHILTENNISPEDLTDEVFDYVLLGKGTPKSALKKSKLKEKVLQMMREEFDYFYPVDMRTSGKDNLQNHLTYYIFHHTAMWEDPSMWPRAISVNGYVTLGGQKMSKSKGNITRLASLIKEVGADVARMNLVGSNENMDDADWREEGIESIESRLDFLSKIVLQAKKANRSSTENVDRYLSSRIQRIISDTTDACEKTKFRSAIQSAFFESLNSLKWYIDRCGGVESCNPSVLRECLSCVVRMLAPFMPHIAEEMWEDMGEKVFVSVAEWPKVDKKEVNLLSELGEDLVRQVIEDARQIEKISGIRPKTVTLIVAPDWKFDVYRLVMKNKGADFKSILSKVKEKNEQTVKYIQALQKRGQLAEVFLDRKSQIEVLNEAAEFIGSQLSAKVKIEEAERSKLEKARNADVLKPAIFIE